MKIYYKHRLFLFIALAVIASSVIYINLSNKSSAENILNPIVLNNQQDEEKEENLVINDREGKVVFSLKTDFDEWTIKIEVYNENDTFQVYKSAGLKIDWYDGTIELAPYEKGSLEIEWEYEGEWCTYILDKIKEAKHELDLKRENIKRDEELKKKQDEENAMRAIEEKKKNFNSLFKNKL